MATLTCPITVQQTHLCYFKKKKKKKINKQIPWGIYVPGLFLFEVLKMGKLTRGPLVLYHLPKYL